MVVRYVTRTARDVMRDARDVTPATHDETRAERYVTRAERDATRAARDETRDARYTTRDARYAIYRGTAIYLTDLLIIDYNINLYRYLHKRSKRSKFSRCCFGQICLQTGSE